MRKIVIMTHGQMANGILNTLSIFTADLQSVTAISAYVDDCDPKAELERFFEEVSETDQVILCTDILGGSAMRRSGARRPSVSCAVPRRPSSAS